MSGKILANPFLSYGDFFLKTLKRTDKDLGLEIDIFFYSIYIVNAKCYCDKDIIWWLAMSQKLGRYPNTSFPLSTILLLVAYECTLNFKTENSWELSWDAIFFHELLKRPLKIPMKINVRVESSLWKHGRMLG